MAPFKFTTGWVDLTTKYTGKLSGVRAWVVGCTIFNQRAHVIYSVVAVRAGRLRFPTDAVWATPAAIVAFTVPSTTMPLTVTR